MAKTATPTGTAKADEAREDFEAAWDLFFGAIRRARGRSAQEAEKEGLSLAQFHLLYAFADRGARETIPVGALAESAGIAQPTATRTLDGLERQGIVKRRSSTADRRSIEVSLSARGRKLLERKRKLVAAKRRAVFDSLSDDDRPAAAALLRHLAEAIEDGR